MRTEENWISKIKTVLLLLMLIPCLSTAINLEPGLHKNNTILSGGIPRTFDYYIPTDLPTEVPLVLLLHGHGGDADGMTGESGKAAPFKVWMSIADTAKFIIVYPEGEFSPIENNTRGWNDCRETAQSNPDVDDVGFLTSLVDTFGSHYSVVPQNSFVAGISNGGFMALRLATEVPEMFGGYAAIVASMPQTSECFDASLPASVLFMNGTADSTMPFEGGNMNGDTSGTRGDALSTWDAVSRWLSLNQISSNGRVDSLPNISKEDSTLVVKHTWESDINQKKVLLYEVIGGGHAEPSKVERYSDWWQDGGWLLGYIHPGVGHQNHDIEMAYEIWNFFSTLESMPSEVTSLISAANKASSKKSAQRAYDLQGRRILKSRGNTHTKLLIMEDKKRSGR